MHELSVTESILEIAIRHAQAQKAKKITGLYLVIGQWSSVVDDSVQFYWDMVSEDTICSGAKLHFTRIPAEFLCNDCHKTFNMDQQLAPCPHCGSMRVKITAGEEFFLASIEIERKE